MTAFRLFSVGLAACAVILSPRASSVVDAQAQGQPGEQLSAGRPVSESTAQIMAREDDPGQPPVRTRTALRGVAQMPVPSFTAITFAETSTLPPDGSGAAGPTQFIAIANGRIRSFTKNGVVDNVLNAKTSTFFTSVKGTGTPYGGRIRYDRLAGRWFIVMATDAVPGRIVLASSNASIITAATTWSFYSFDDTFLGTDCTTDAPSLGIDPAALYIGANQFCTNGTTFRGSSAWVVRKASVVDGAAAVITAFHDLTGGAGGSGPYAPQGVTNDDPSITTGYFLGVDNVAFGNLVLRRISSPGGTPTISGNIPIAVPLTALPTPVRHQGNTGGSNGYLSANDDRLASIYLRGTTAWVAHTINVTEAGIAGGTRDGVRWYQIQSLDSTPVVVQSGTLRDTNAPGSVDARNYFNASIATNAIGRTVIGFSAAGTNEFVNAGVVDRYASDATGQLPRSPVLITSASTSYNPPADAGGANGRRWGSYSETVMDGCDGTTVWSLQQFVNGANSYGLQAIRVQGEPPPSLVSVTPSVVNSNLPSINLVVKGTLQTPEAAFVSAPAGFACAISASIPGVTVNSVTINSPTQVTINISTVNAVGGDKPITVINPDGQTSTGAILSVLGGPVMAIETPTGGAVGQPVYVRGWAIDTAAISGTGVDAVHVYATPIGGAPVFLGAATYGSANTTAAQNYGAQFGPSGFSVRAPQALPPGSYTITAYAHSAVSGTFSNSQSVTVTLKAPSAPVGALDTPAANATVAGEMGVTGWAVDEAGVKQVDIYRSPTTAEGTALIFIGQAIFSRGARPDVQALFPSYVDSDSAGWGYMVLTNMLPNQGNGAFTFYAYATNYAGQTTLLGSRRVTLANSTSTKPFGSIDTPGQGATVSGVVVNFGWALATAGRSIPVDGSTIDVYVDNVFVGHPVYNNFRADIAALFPGLANSNGAVGYFMLDTQTLADGIHTIAWIIRDDAGQTSGVGSRFFRVQNGS